MTNAPPQPAPGGPCFQFTFWHVAEWMVGLGLAFALFVELRQRAIGIGLECLLGLL